MVPKLAPRPGLAFRLRQNVYVRRQIAPQASVVSLGASAPVPAGFPALLSPDCSGCGLGPIGTILPPFGPGLGSHGSHFTPFRLRFGAHGRHLAPLPAVVYAQLRTFSPRAASFGRAWLCVCGKMAPMGAKLAPGPGIGIKENTRH